MTTIVLLSSLGLISMITGLFGIKKYILPVVISGLLIIFAIHASGFHFIDENGPLFNNMLRSDNFSFLFSGLIILLTLLIVFQAGKFESETDIPLPELLTLFVFAITGSLIMVSYTHLVMLFLGVETLSICLYVLAGSRRTDLASNEAAMKYFLMGAFATGFLLFGITLVYGATGSFHLENIATQIQNASIASSPMLAAGILMMLIGLAFKVGAVPFHFWTPDVYEGSPALVTSFMATVVKTAGFAAFFRLFYLSFAHMTPIWNQTLWVIAALTMTLGNITAIYQQSVKRLVAYSGIAHTGYMLLAVLALSQSAITGILFYAIAYSTATIAIFAVFIKIQKTYKLDTIDSFNGFAKKNPFAAFAVASALCSLAGIPPLAGFFGKFYIFSMALQQHNYWLVVIAILNSCISVYYYFRIIIAMYMKKANDEQNVEIDKMSYAVLVICILISFVLGIFPDLILGMNI
jgi:NADH-quinone oxidoreductase subunit N